MHLFIYLGGGYGKGDQKGIEHKPSNGVTEPSKSADISKLPKATQQDGRILGYTIVVGFTPGRRNILISLRFSGEHWKYVGRQSFADTRRRRGALLEGSFGRSNRKRVGRERRPTPSPDDRWRLEA